MEERLRPSKSVQSLTADRPSTGPCPSHPTLHPTKHAEVQIQGGGQPCPSSTMEERNHPRCTSGLFGSNGHICTQPFFTLRLAKASHLHKMSEATKHGGCSSYPQLTDEMTEALPEKQQLNKAPQQRLCLRNSSLNPRRKV